jgi:type II secretion system protein I
MKNRLTTFSHLLGSRGLTLIEVLAALAILATMLWGVLAVKTSAIRQAHRAEQQLVAVEIADQLLNQWCASGETPVPDEGGLEAHPSWGWRTTIVSDSESEVWGSEIAELQIVDLSGDKEYPPILSVQFLLPPRPRGGSRPEDGNP